MAARDPSEMEAAKAAAADEDGDSLAGLNLGRAEVAHGRSQSLPDLRGLRPEEAFCEIYPFPPGATMAAAGAEAAAQPEIDDAAESAAAAAAAAEKKKKKTEKVREAPVHLESRRGREFPNPLPAISSVFPSLPSVPAAICLCVLAASSSSSSTQV